MDRVTKRVKPKEKRPYKIAEYEDFVRFTALPRILRDEDFGFHTDEDFIERRKLSSSTVYTWKKSEGFWKQVKMTRQQWGRDRTPDVIIGLYRTAVKEGRAPEVKLWLEIFEDFSTRTETSINVQRDELKAIQDSMRSLIIQEKSKSLQ